MEEEIDLRPYILALLRRWRFIVALTIVIAAVATLPLLLSKPGYTATADVLITNTRSQVTFDSRFVTSDQTQGTSARQKALIALASSNSLEVAVQTTLPEDVVAVDYEPGDLLNSIDIAQQGDLLKISASADDQNKALVIAETWVQAYEQLANDIYGRDETLLANIQKQMTEAEERYDAAQQELEDFISTNDLVRLEQQVKSLEWLLDGSREANQTLYTEYLTRTQELDLILSDIQTLRQQVAEDQSASLSSSLAALALRARSVGIVGLPFDLQFTDPNALTQIESVTLADLDVLAAVVQQRQNELRAQAEALAAAIAGNETNIAGIDPTPRSTYEQQLAAARSGLEQLKARQNLLETRRNLAQESVSILQRKLDEQRIAQNTVETDVRVVGTTIDRPESLTSRIALRGAIGLFAGFFLSIIFVLFIDIVRPGIASMQAGQASAKRSADNPIAS